MTGAGARISMMVVGFVLTPYIINSLGFRDFGLWATVGSMAGYLGLLDFGVGGSFVKFITEYAELGNHAAARQVVSFGMLFYVVFGLVLAVPVFLLAPTLVHLFKMPPAEYENGVRVFRILFSFLIASMIFGVPGSIVVSMHRMDLAVRNNLIGYVFYAVSIAVLLHLGWRLNGVIAAQGIQMVVTTLLQYITARRLFGPIWHKAWKYELVIVRRMFSFGGWTQLTAVCNLVTFDIGRFITAGIVGVASVTFYEVGGKLAFISRTLPNYLVAAVSPAAVAADTRNDAAAVDRMYVIGSLYLMAMTTALAGFFWAACVPIMHVWLGSEYPFVQGIVLFLAIGYVVGSTATIGMTIFRSIGKPELETLCAAVGAGVNAVAALVLAPRFGVVGVAAGIAIASGAVCVCFSVVYHRMNGTRWWPATGATSLRISAAGIASSLALSELVRIETARSLFAHKLLGVATIGADGLVYGALFLWLTWTCGAWRFDETRIRIGLSGLRLKLHARLSADA